ncbi:glutathione gamma-glutamylcysteinyltransferase [Leptolyngbya sp. 'hensonii']|uniref:phytochelatin synthase family protein n=1 Tax=Leptolyngbya sp. 'hensonii' TaxID=1922337 RepID=UPI00094FC639|nr:phytochelatin synthase family protein [Leptolyngbya sp. 'hensonii']OLP16647.1 glutathione gamma-glutamylcysteinyltransferase [Leptolyngbya sp. 'hensonii']
MRHKTFQPTVTFSRWLIVALGMVGGMAISQPLALPPALIAFNSPKGEELFLKSNARDDYWNLSIQFVTQINQAYCGVASMVMVLNSLGIPAPTASQYQPYRTFTQENFFDNPATQQVLSPNVVRRQGMTLEELGKLLGSYPVTVQVYHSADSSLEEFRRLAVKNLSQPGNFVLVNYLRSKIGQERGGHISPLAAYNRESDRFLILDVARYKYPPVWVSAQDLWQAMATTDPTAGKTRGFVLVSRRQ